MPTSPWQPASWGTSTLTAPIRYDRMMSREGGVREGEGGRGEEGRVVTWRKDVLPCDPQNHLITERTGIALRVLAFKVWTLGWCSAPCTLGWRVRAALDTSKYYRRWIVIYLWESWQDCLWTTCTFLYSGSALPPCTCYSKRWNMKCIDWTVNKYISQRSSKCIHFPVYQEISRGDSIDKMYHIFPR